jgi:molybdopterin molybdotransferase
LLISGGVSAGRYDFVEQALAALGAEFYFDRVLIQPGQPLVFGCTGGDAALGGRTRGDAALEGCARSYASLGGRARGTFYFGLPGNPIATMVCFELFARAALELLGGQRDPQLPITEAALTTAFRHKPGLTRFLPARLDEQGRVTPLRSAGSADIAAVCRANAYLVTAPDKPEYAAGERIGVLLRLS